MTTTAQAPGRLRMTPGRRAALALGVPLALILIAWTGFSFVSLIGSASFPIGQDIGVPRSGPLSLSTGGGNLTVRQGQGGTARLAGTVQYSLVRPDVTVVPTAAGAAIRVGCPVIAQGNCTLDATLAVPPRTAVALSSGGGDLSVSGIDSDVTLTSGGGNVAVSGVAGTVSVSTNGGDLTADNLARTLSFATNGGNINGTALTSPDVAAESTGGDVTLAFTEPPRRLVIQSNGGNITVELPHNNVGYDVVTSADGGNVSDDQVNISTRSPDTFTADSGGGDITITEAG